MAKKGKPVQEDLATTLTNLFLPVHYRIGVALEETLRCGLLSRKQVANLWLMQTEGGAARSMRRKDIEHLLADWFETSSSTITRAADTSIQDTGIPRKRSEVPQRPGPISRYGRAS